MGVVVQGSAVTEITASDNHLTPSFCFVLVWFVLGFVVVVVVVVVLSGRIIPENEKNGTLVTTLSGALHYRVSAVTGWPGVSTVAG